MAEVRMPQLGETVTEGTITRWFKQVGQQVDEGEALFEVSTDKVDSEVPSPVSGVVVELRVPEGETVQVGAVLAVVEGDAGAVEPPAASSPTPTPTPTPSAREAEGAAAPVSPPPSAEPAEAPAPVVEGVVLSPLVRRLIAEQGLDVAELVGTGVGGRITRSDVERAIRERGPRPAAPAPASIAATGDSVRSRTVPLNNIRRITGEHMVRSKATSPHAVTVVEVDYEVVERVRQAHRDRFREEEGFSLTYLPFIARAVIDAIEEFPYLNASVGDGELIVHDPVNLSVAVDLDFEGLVAPVVADADQKRLRFIAREIHDVAARARARQLSPDEVVGGTFTITNAGSYGTHLVLPVINQPQVAILSTDGISRKPVVVTGAGAEEAISIHSVGMLAMSWDHRAFDGAYAAAFLARVREIIETRDWEAEL